MKFADRSSRRVLLREFFSDKDADPYGIKKFDEFDTILDIGANVGMFALQARFVHPVAKIIAIEPNDKNFKILRSNVEHLNVYTDKFMFGNDGRGDSSKGRKSVSLRCVESPTGKLVSKSLTTIVDEYNIDVPNSFFKIDCEGGELYMQHHEPSLDVIRNCKGFGMEIHGDFPYWKGFLESLKDTFDIVISGRRIIQVNGIRK
jgi:FkbM family methyltransferase